MLKNIIIALLAAGTAHAQPFECDNNYGECGMVGNIINVTGKDYVAGPGKEYYAYCARKL